MKLQLNINYHTAPDERLYAELTTNEATTCVEMTAEYNGNWTLDYTLPPNCEILSYCYMVINSKTNTTRTEWNAARTVNCKARSIKIIYDAWANLPNNYPYYSSAFSKGFFQREKQITKKIQDPNPIILEVKAPTLPPNADLIIAGESDYLQKWNIDCALKLDDSNAPTYSIRLPIEAIMPNISFKLAARCRKTNTIIAWDKGENRIFPIVKKSENPEVIIRNITFEPQLAPFRCAGVAIPIFSLRSESSWGIGEYNDLRKLIDWAKETDQNIIQILPINDTTISHQWTDSYPYNSISIYALNPLYLNPISIGTSDHVCLNQEFEAARKALNQLEVVDYEAVDLLKWEYFNTIFQQKKKSYQNDDLFQKWYRSNRDWLIPYAGFCTLRDKNKSADFRTWEEYSTFNAEKIELLVETNGVINEVAGIYIFLQYHAHCQLSSVTKYAHEQGVVLKGDIPIGISRNSVEAWKEPYLFNLNGQAGAPPDDFSKNGQNWGFPTYRWEEMAKDRYNWWKQRFSKMAQYFDAYRIDHLLGFFRIWQIPMHSVEGLLGHFNPALPLSQEEISQFGITFNAETMCNPCLSTDQIEIIFQENSSYSFENLLQAFDGKWRPNEQYSTQKSVSLSQFSEQPATDSAIKESLFRLINDVLFVEDTTNSGTYHPRITGYETYAYQNLDTSSQQAYMRLYEDFYFIRHNEFWKMKASERLSELIGATNMLVCAEDLGMIPACVPDVMNDLQLLSLEIQRMPKELGVRFGNTKNYPYLAVAATSTHDMSTIREWWEEDQQATQHYYNTQLEKEGSAPRECNGAIAQQIIEQHLQSPAMLTILPLQDWLAIDETIRRKEYQDERINIPSNPNHYWQYRMHITLEELITADKLNKTIAEMIRKNHRK